MNMNKITEVQVFLHPHMQLHLRLQRLPRLRTYLKILETFFEHQFVDFWTDEFVDAFKDFGDWFTGDFLDFWENDFADWWENDFADFWTEDFVDFMTEDFVNFWTEDFVEFWSDGFVDLMLEDIPEALAAMPEAAAIYVVLLGTQALVSELLDEDYDDNIPDIPDWFTGDFVDSW